MTELSQRCKKTYCVTGTGFLSPEEQAEAEAAFSRRTDKPVFFGGYDKAERKAAFFLPEFETNITDRIVCIRLIGSLQKLSHRDYLGAVLGLGLEREAIGDILPGKKEAYLYCLPAAGRLIEESLIKVGKQNVLAEAVSLSAAPIPVIQTQAERFTVKSVRFDAVVAGLFHLSRTEAAERIARGDCSLNHRQMLKPDVPIKEGDTLILHGKGKGTVKEIGGKTKKDRVYIVCARRI